MAEAASMRTRGPVPARLRRREGQSPSALPGDSDIDLCGYGEDIIDFDAKIPDGALDLGMQGELKRLNRIEQLRQV
jgi:hypothetical protein